jgi:MFS family permease
MLAEDHEAAPVQSRRNVLVLTGAQAFAASGPPVITALGGIVGQMLAPSKALATLPVSLLTVGIALGTIPVAMLVRRMGRRPTYLLGCLVGVSGGLLAAFAIFSGSFPLFCLSSVFVGLNGACVQSYRFAAVDVSAGSMPRGTAISYVMLGGLAAAVIGPQMVIHTRGLISGVPFTASFIGQAILILLAFVLLLGLNAKPVATHAVNRPRSFREIARTPRFLAALGTGIVSHATMTFVMVATPLAMLGCGHTVDEAALGIQWHVLAMYGPSFFTGRLIRRFGEERITLCGLILIAVGAILALTGLSLFHFWGTLILLGFGWNLGFIGATSIVAGCSRPEEQAKVQGTNDFLVFGASATASLLSGGLVQVSGWGAIGATALFAVTAAATLLIVTSRRARRRAPKILLDVAIP